jgi:hypothetical protein
MVIHIFAVGEQTYKKRSRIIIIYKIKVVLSIGRRMI